MDRLYTEYLSTWATSADVQVVEQQLTNLTISRYKIHKYMLTFIFEKLISPFFSSLISNNGLSKLKKTNIFVLFIKRKK